MRRHISMYKRFIVIAFEMSLIAVIPWQSVERKNLNRGIKLRRPDIF